MTDLPPPLIGAGLTGRTVIGRGVELEPEFDEGGNPVAAAVRDVGQTMPGNCRRVLSSPLAPGHGGGCPPGCVGQQPDGGCLCDIVRAANMRGVAWSFEIRVDEGGEHWSYNGPPLD